MGNMVPTTGVTWLQKYNHSHLSGWISYLNCTLNRIPYNAVLLLSSVDVCCSRLGCMQT